MQWVDLGNAKMASPSPAEPAVRQTSERCVRDDRAPGRSARQVHAQRRRVQYQEGRVARPLVMPRSHRCGPAHPSGSEARVGQPCICVWPGVDLVLLLMRLERAAILGGRCSARSPVAPGSPDVVMRTPCPIALSTIRGPDNGGHAAERPAVPSWCAGSAHFISL